jgi:hypothetical protein
MPATTAWTTTACKNPLAGRFPAITSTKEMIMVFKEKQKVYWVRRNGEKAVGRVVVPEYAKGKGTFVDVQPINDAGKPVGKANSLRPSQLSKQPV